MPNNSRNHRVSLPFQLLKTFTERELINFKKLLDSGYLSSNESLNKLLKILQKQAFHHSSFSPDLQVEVYKALYNKENIGEKLSVSQNKKLNRLMNELVTAAEKFLMFEDIRSTDKYDTMILYPKFIDRNQLLLYSKRIKATEKKLSKVEKKGIQYHNQCYQIQKEKERLLFVNNSLAKEDNYDELQYHLDIKYLLRKLQYHLAKVTLQHTYAHKTFDLESYISIQHLLNLPKYKANPLIQLYVLNIILVESKSETTFVELSELLKQKHGLIPSEFLNIFYINLTNYCTNKLAKGDLNYYKHLFDIYNDMDESNLLVPNKFIELALLKNMLTTACRINAFDWASKKLDFYINYVPKTIRISVYEYHKGIIAFNQQKHDVALNHLIKVRKIDTTHELSLRIAQLQCYYETDSMYETETQQMIDSLKSYVRQHKQLTEHRKTAYHNFILIFNKLYKLNLMSHKWSKDERIKKALPKIKSQFLELKPIWRKLWILNKIKDLENA